MAYKERILTPQQLKKLSEHKYSCSSSSLMDRSLATALVELVGLQDTAMVGSKSYNHSGFNHKHSDHINLSSVSILYKLQLHLYLFFCL